MSVQEDFEARARSMVEKARERGDVDEQESKPKARAEIAQLPIWPEPERAAPNDVLRSALFAVVEKGQRKQYEKQLLISWKGSEIRYTGKQLDQYDLDVWQQSLHLARTQGLGEEVTFGGCAFLRALGRSVGGSGLSSLKDSFHRMRACAVEIRGNGYSLIGGLVDSCFYDEAKERFVLRLNRELKAMFDAGHARIDWDARRALKTDVARWLHGYACSHKATTQKPHRIGIERLRALCGSSTARLRAFREKIRKAMTDLESQGVVISWHITEGDALEFARQ